MNPINFTNDRAMVVFGDEDIIATTIGLAINAAIGESTNINRAICSCSEGARFIIGTRSQQFSPRLRAIRVVFGDERIITSTMGLAIKAAKGGSAGINRSI